MTDSGSNPFGEPDFSALSPSEDDDTDDDFTDEDDELEEEDDELEEEAERQKTLPMMLTRPTRATRATSPPRP